RASHRVAVVAHDAIACAVIGVPVDAVGYSAASGGPSCSGPAANASGVIGASPTVGGVVPKQDDTAKASSSVIKHRGPVLGRRDVSRRNRIAVGGCCGSVNQRGGAKRRDRRNRCLAQKPPATDPGTILLRLFLPCLTRSQYGNTHCLFHRYPPPSHPSAALARGSSRTPSAGCRIRHRRWARYNTADRKHRFGECRASTTRPAPSRAGLLPGRSGLP